MKKGAVSIPKNELSLAETDDIELLPTAKSHGEAPEVMIANGKCQIFGSVTKPFF